ncbi:PREDICTED: heat shock transcription factor, Y-linked-like [Branchiostoma belcheri]|uniref:Heat shock transcription factor, Y-linked-like n=1 Tax=Branchiostoma belcheri TaxID=7741 RepID=A0A6P5AA30_BRABE|nr:PREDICTED: heat shock transcription factor, Y-linked-like [Branchiostoma belcheri]
MALLGGLKFPEVLWRIVNDDRFDSINWSEEGTSIIVREQDFMEEVLESEGEKKVFQTNSFASFIRNLNFYGFACRRIATENENAIHSCFCPYFRRDRPELRSRVSRGPNSRRWMALFDADGTPREGVKGVLDDLTTNNGNKRRSLFTDVKRDEDLAAKYVRIAPKSCTSSAALLLGEHNISDAAPKVLREPAIQPRRLSSLRPPSPSLKKLVHDALEIPTTQPMMTQLPVVLIPQQQQSSQPGQIVYMLPIIVQQSPLEMATTAVQTTATLPTETCFTSNVVTQMPTSAQRDLPRSPTSQEDSPAVVTTEGHPTKTSTYDDATLEMTCEDVTVTSARDKPLTRPGKIVRRAGRNQARTTRVFMHPIDEEGDAEL